jgi:hypothetical protein
MINEMSVAPLIERSSAGVSFRPILSLRNDAVSILFWRRFTKSDPDIAIPCHSLLVRRQSILAKSAEMRLPIVRVG